VFWALAGGARAGVFAGFVVGLVADAEAGRFLGLSSGVLSAIGFGVGSMGNSLHRERPPAQFVVLFFAAVDRARGAAPVRHYGDLGAGSPRSRPGLPARALYRGARAPRLRRFPGARRAQTSSPMARPQLNREARNARAAVLAGFMGLGFATLVAGTVRLQLVHHEEYRQLAEQNRVRLEVVRAPRGRIFDRKAACSPTTAPAFSIVYRPPEYGEVADRLVAHLQAELLTRSSGCPGPSSTPWSSARSERASARVPLGRRAPDRVAGRGVARRPAERRGRGQPAQAVPARASRPAHLLGYAGEINDAELEQRKDKGYASAT
jgi:hypothetical protein